MPVVLPLPTTGEPIAFAAKCCAAPLPSGNPDSVRLLARRCAGFADELIQMDRFVRNPAGLADWTGKAALAFRQRLAESAPDLTSTARRYSAYAAVLLTYASASTEAGKLTGLALALGAQLGTARQAHATMETARSSAASVQDQLIPQLPGLRPQNTAAAVDAAVVAARRARDLDEELLIAARRFAARYNVWADALAMTSAALRRADSQDPHHDLHGWAQLRHRVSSAVSGSAGLVRTLAADVVDPVGTYLAHPSWRNLSAALGAVSSGLSMIALPLLPVFPELALVCMAAAAMLSALQTGVDCWRKWGENEDVSFGTLAFDAVGAIPFGGAAPASRAALVAGRAGWRSSTGVARVGGFASGAAPVLRATAQRALRHPIEFWQPDVADVPSSLYRSGSHGGTAALARRWAGPLLWDAPNAVAGLPAVGAGSSPQYAWNHRDDLRRATLQVVHSTEDAGADAWGRVRRGVK